MKNNLSDRTCKECGAKDNLTHWMEYSLCDSCEYLRIRNLIENKNHDTDVTDEITCPWCGYEHGDSWEYKHNEDDLECDECGNEFTFWRDITVDYSTRKKGEDRHLIEAKPQEAQS